MDKIEKERFESHYQEYLKGIGQRQKEIVDLRHQKWTLKQIGDKFQISAERVRQILEAAAKAGQKTLAKSESGEDCR